MAEATQKGDKQSPKPSIELEISGNADWTDCTVDSVVGYPNRPARLELELLERKPGSSIGKSVSGHKVTLVYENGVAGLEHADLSHCDKASTFEVRVEMKGQFHASKPAQVKVVSAAAGAHGNGSAKPSSSKFRLRLGIEGESVEGPGFVAVIPIETADDRKHPNSATVKVRLVKGQDVQFLDNSTKTVIAGSTGRFCQITSDAHEQFLLAVDFNGQLEAEVEISYPDAHEAKKFKLEYPL